MWIALFCIVRAGWTASWTNYAHRQPKSILVLDGWLQYKNSSGNFWAVKELFNTFNKYRRLDTLAVMYSIWQFQVKDSSTYTPSNLDEWTRWIWHVFVRSGSKSEVLIRPMIISFSCCYYYYYYYYYCCYLLLPFNGCFPGEPVSVCSPFGYLRRLFQKRASGY